MLICSKNGKHKNTFMQEKKSNLKSVLIAAKWHEKIAEQLENPILPEEIVPEEAAQKLGRITEQRLEHIKFAKALTALLEMKPLKPKKA